MGLLNTLRDVGSIGLAPLTGGMSLFGASEDTRSRIPLVGPLTGAQSDEQRALIEKQKQMAADAERRRKLNEQARMNALAQQVQAFNPRNQVMAQMFGPEAAFTPEQFAQMVQNPMPQEQPWGTGTDQQRQDQVMAKEAEKRRQQMVQQSMTPLGPGPAPLRRPPPQAGRRY